MSNTNNLDLASICNQRLRQLLYTVPPNRNELQKSPYPQYTQVELDMRRKTEILKYKNPSQSNGLTRSRRWAQIVNGSSRSNITTPPICNTDLISTPSYACDVPGPITYFITDTTVPLYKYKTNIDSYAVSLTENKKLWNIITEKNIFFASGISTKLFTLSINPKIDSPIYNFQYQTPIGLYANGSIKALQNLSIKDLSFGINLVNTTFLYNKNEVNPIQKVNITPIINIPVISFDISYVYQSNNSTSEYQVLYYVGMLTVSNIELYTEPGFIYDFYLTFYTNEVGKESSYYSNTISTNNYGVYCNLSEKLLNVPHNTLVHSLSNPPSYYQGFQFSGNSV